MSFYGGRGPPDIKGMSSLKVDNLTYRTTPEDLRRSFEKYGDIGDIYIPRDRFTRESRGFAFVRWANMINSNKSFVFSLQTAVTLKNLLCKQLIKKWSYTVNVKACTVIFE